MASNSNSNTTFYNSLPPSHRSLYKNYAHTINKLCAQCSRKDFLRRCKKFGVHPTHIQNNFRCINGLLEDASPYRRKLQKAVDHFKRTILNIEISDSFHNIKKLETQKTTLTGQITQVSPPHTYTPFFSHQEIYFQRQYHRFRISMDSKFQRLFSRIAAENNKNLKINTNWIKNTTDVTVPTETMILLSYGPKFALPFENNHEIPYFKIMADLESILKLEPDENLQMAYRNQLINTIQNYIHKRRNGHLTSSQDATTRFLTHALHVSKKFIRDNPNVCIVPADKGNKTVIMDRDEYESKMQTIVTDSNTYERITSDLTHKTQTKNNSLVNALFEKKLIDLNTKIRLITHNAVCPKIYGLPKIHKEGSPLRVILSCVNCPTYQLSKYLANILHQSIDHEKYNIQNSYEFCTFINNITLPPNYVLVSFDVVSLFTVIPRELAVQAVDSNWSLIEKNTTIKDKDLFINLIEFNLSSSYFVFRGEYYRQRSGTSMGNPLSPALADLVMDTLLDDVLAKIDFQVPFIKKYVDDLITAVPADKVDEMNSSLSGFNANIKFTCEVESNSRLPYLDMLLIRTGETIATDWYKKPVSSGRILNYFSLHPLAQKLNTASGFIGRVYRLSTIKSADEKKKTVRELLLMNNYPSSLVNRLINRFVNRGTEHNVETNANQNSYRILHHVDSLTPALAKIVRRNQTNVSLSFKCIKTTKLLFSKLKDPVALLSKRNVIYRIPCAESSCGSGYIGYTTQQLKNRLAGHRSLINRFETKKQQHPECDEGYDEFKKTALMKHLIEEDHKFDLMDVKILDSDDRLQALQFLEMCYIASDSTSINHRTDTSNLSVAYSGILYSLTQSNRLVRHF